VIENRLVVAAADLHAAAEFDIYDGATDLSNGCVGFIFSFTFPNVYEYKVK